MKFEISVYHYTKDKDFRLNEIVIKNSGDYWCKPKGGIWTSPVGCEYGWDEFCEEADCISTDGRPKIELSLSGEFIVIDSIAHLDKLPWVSLMGSGIEYIDFEKLVKEGIDGIYLTEQGERRTRIPYMYGGSPGKFRNLNGWDCECVLILNDKCVRSWKEII